MNQSLYLVTSFFALISDRFDSRKDRGATAVEYGLMVGLIAVVIIVAVVTLGDTLMELFADTNNALFENTDAGERVEVTQ